jgi:hypothetical protein
MLISYKHQFIFIHIFKPAGTAVSEGFAPYSRPIDRLVYGYRPTVKFFNAFNILTKRKGMEWLTGFHKHAKAMDIKEKLPAGHWDKYFKFAFGRNPWDWNVSLYFYLRGNKRLPSHQKVINESFSDFIKRRCGNRPAQQIDFISDVEKRILVDCVGKFENIEADVNSIRNRLGLKPLQLPRRNISLKRPRSDYRSFYDSETAELMARSFADDIRIFNYCFNDFARRS